jgi:hypothetical protein
MGDEPPGAAGDDFGTSSGDAVDLAAAMVTEEEPQRGELRRRGRCRARGPVARRVRALLEQPWRPGGSSCWASGMLAASGG